MPQTLNIPLQTRVGTFRPETVNLEARTIEVVWSTGAEVRRFDWWTGKRYNESLSLDPAHVRMGRLASGAAPVLDTHDGYQLSSVIGVVERAELGNEAVATLRFADTPDVADIWRKVQTGIIRNVSVGYTVYAYEKTERDDGPDDWRAIDWEPFELSMVPIGADAGAGARAATRTNPCTLETLPNHTESTMPPEAVETVATTESRAVDTTAPATTTPATTPAAAVATAIVRAGFAEVTAACRVAGLADADRDAIFTDVEARNLGMDAVRAGIFERLATRANAAPTDSRVTITRDAQDTTRSMVESALLHRFDPVTYKLEDGAREWRGMSLMEIGAALVRGRGERMLDLDKMGRAGFVLGLDVRSGGLHTTSDFPLILANVANKTLRAGYEAAPRTFLPWTRRNTATDFKTMSRNQLGSAPAFKEVNENGEFTYGTIGEGREQYALATFGRIVGVTRQAIINDDMGAFTRIPQLMGNAAANNQSNIIYAILADNDVLSDAVALFHADHGNLAGSGAAPDATTIAAAMTAIGSQTGVDSDDTTYLNLQGRYLLGGWATDVARKQYTSANYQPTAQSSINVYASSLVPITEARISGNAWYVSADPMQVDTIEYAFLDGNDAVNLETRVGFEVDGVELRARQDFAAKAIDHRGLYKNAGAGG